jgi:CelD/BcsL family acetyltransferase involved in cellulose biosynthesis
LSDVTLLSPDDPGWQSFAVTHATSPLQRPNWLWALSAAYGLTSQVAALVDSQGGIYAGLPMIRSKLPWRRRWNALPFTDTLEPVAVDASRRYELLRALSASASLQPLLMRTQADVPGWFSRQVGTRHQLDLAGGIEHVLANATRTHRRAVNRARRPTSGLSTRLITSRREFLGPCLALTARSRRRLGAPTQPQRYWSMLWDLQEQGAAMTVGVYLGDRLVASGIFLLGNGHGVAKHSASELATRDMYTNYAMFATAFERLAERGVRSMDFGISDLGNEGLRTFKSRWGAVEHPAHFSATDPALLPATIEPGRVVKAAIKQTPVFFGRAMGSLAYAFTA